MKNKNWKNIFSLVLLEFLALNLSLLIIFLLTYFSTTFKPENETLLKNYFSLVLLFNCCWVLILYFYGNAESYLDQSFKRRIKFQTLNSFILIGIIFLVSLYFQVDYFIQIALLLHVFLFNSLNLLFAKLWLQLSKKQKKVNQSSRVLIVGDNKNWEQRPDFAKTVEYHGYQVIGMLNSHPVASPASRFAVNGNLEDLSTVLEANPIDEIFISLSSMQEKDIKLAIEAADYHGVRVNLVPEAPDFLAIDLKPSTFYDIPVFKLRKSPLDEFKNSIIKFAFDKLFALTALLCLSPIYAIVSLLIYLEDGGPIFYRPIRKGEKGTTFKCYKFRTMSECDDPVNGQKSTERNDPRVTRVGKFIRKYDIDELPQFLNVLKGDMSVVGPRPHRTFLQDDFRKIVNEYMVRHYIKPGITGWAQVNGWRGPTQTNEQKIARVKHDLWYIEHWSLWLDIKIIYLTVFGKKTRQNAF